MRILWSLLQISQLAYCVAGHMLSDSADENARSVTVHATTRIGRFKPLQGTMNIDDFWLPPETGNNGTDKDDALGRLYPEYGIKDVILYTFPKIWNGWSTPGLDAVHNDNYNWTAADEWIGFVVSNGAKASLDFRPSFGGNVSITSFEQMGEIGYMLADRYMNGANGSGFKNALNLIDFYPESDVADFDDIEERYQRDFQYFAAFARGVANASGAWGGNRAYLLDNNYTVPSPYVARFYRDCVEHDVPIGAATWHFVSTFFSFNPYDIKTTTDHLREKILSPAGLPDLPIYVTHVQPNPRAATLDAHLDAYAYDEAFLAAFHIGTSMYTQDTSLEVIYPWAGFSYGGIAGRGAFFMGFFNQTSDDEPIPLNAAKAVALQNKLIQETPWRLQVDGHSADGFAVLAGASEDECKVHVLLNNYQLDYDLPKAISKNLAQYVNGSTAAYPLFQDNGLLNTEALCFKRGNKYSFMPVCPTFPYPTVRDNNSTAYHLYLEDLPWSGNDRYRVDIRRIGSRTLTDTFDGLCQYGVGNRLNLSLPFSPNAQDLITITLVE